MPPVRDQRVVAAPATIRFELLEERAVMSSTPLNLVPVILPTVVASVPSNDALQRVFQSAVIDQTRYPLAWDEDLHAIHSQAPTFALTNTYTGVLNPLVTPLLGGLKFTSFSNGDWWMDVPPSQQALIKQTLAFQRGEWNRNQFGRFGMKGDLAAPGDWNGDGIDQIATFRMRSDEVTGFANLERDRFGRITDPRVPVSQRRELNKGIWYIDANSTNWWENAIVDRRVEFGQGGDRPVVGDWAARGRDAIGVFRIELNPSQPTNPNAGMGVWYLDANGNFTWDGFDRRIHFGAHGDTPVVGDWNGDGRDEIGVVRKEMLNGRLVYRWYLDSNNLAGYQGNDISFVFGTGVEQPVVADFDGDGRSDVGLYYNGRWMIDTGIVSRGRYQPFTFDYRMDWKTPINPKADDAQIFPMIRRGPGIYDVARRVSLFPPYRFGYAELSPSTTAVPPLPPGVAYPTFPRPILLPAGTAPPGRIATLPNPNFFINQQPSPLGPMQPGAPKPIISSGTLSQIRPSNDQTSLPGDPRAIERSRPQSSGGGILGIDAGNEVWILDAGRLGGEFQRRADVIDRALETVEEPWLA